jgi:zinc protease
MKLKFLLAAGLVLGTAGASIAQNLPFDPMVRTGKLANGFTYYIRHNEEPKDRVIFYLANKAGSVLEADDQRGLAHFMEHMSFNGTIHFPKNELINYLQKAGVRFGADINAYTSFDETVYQLPLPSDNPEVVKNGIEIMHDWAHGALLEPAEIDKERGVVLEEKRLGKGAGERMREKYFPQVLNNSRYANRLPIGIDEVLNNFKPEAIKRFYHDWYRPDLQAIIIVGDINVDKMEQIVKAKFADLKNPENEKPRTSYTIPLTGKNQFIAVTDPEMKATNLSVIIKKPRVPLHTAAHYREHLVQSLYNSMIDERLGELSRQSSAPPFLEASIGIDHFMANLDAYQVSVSAKPGELENGFKAVWRENERAKRFGFNVTELQRAKTRYINRIASALKEQDKTRSDNFVHQYLQYFLDGNAAPGITYEYDLVKKDLDGISINELNAAAKTYSKNTDRDVLLTAPEKEKSTLPTEAVFTKWTKAVEAEDIQPFKDDVSTASLLKTEPASGKIISRQQDDHGITTMMLSNGVKVLLKPTDFKNDQIIFAGFGPGGTSLYSDADYQSAAAANAIPAVGAGNYNSTQLTKFLAGKQLGAQTSIGEQTQNISGNAVKDDLETALKLMYARITEPRRDTSVFKGMIDRTKASLANRANDPNSVYQDTIAAVLGNHNVRRTGPSLEKVDQINWDKAFNIYKERFANARGFTFVFVGNIDTVSIKPLLEKYIASLPAGDKPDEAKDLKINPPAGIIEKTVYKGLEPKASVNLVFSGSFDYSFSNRLIMEAFQETLQIRLLERLREDESGVYSPSARVNFSKIPSQRFTLSISFGCAPQNVDKLIASALDEIEKIKKDGPPQINLDKYKAQDQKTMETSLKSNNFWVSYLSGQLQNKEDINQIDNYFKWLNTITTADVKNAASKYITGKNYIKLVLMPEKKN